MAACASVPIGGDPVMLAPPAIAAAPPPDWQGIQIIARLAAAFELPVPPAVLDGVIRWQLSTRDELRELEDRLVAAVEGAGPGIPMMPDLTVLTTEPVAHTESSGFGWRDDPIRHTRAFHSGTDFRGKPGTPVVAAGDGIVKFCGRLGGYGNAIDIDHGGGLMTRYAHLRRIETTKGSLVAAGQAIGQVGSTGRTTGPHLHFEVRLDGAPVSPITAMSIAALERSSPLEGRLAALSLSPELQSATESDVDPPRQRAKPTHRPERTGRARREQVLW